MKNVKDLTINQLNLLTAKVEGIKVVEHEGRIARELPFSPDGAANDYCLKEGKMWLNYEPAIDWSIAGPIMERERICVNYSDGDVEDLYAWAYYPGEERNVLFGITGSEAVIRSFIAKVYGDTINIEQLPSFTRTAIVNVSGFTCEDWTDKNFSDVYVREEIEVEAATTDEAELKGIQYMNDYFSINSDFQRWK